MSSLLVIIPYGRHPTRFKKKFFHKYIQYVTRSFSPWLRTALSGFAQPMGDFLLRRSFSGAMLWMASHSVVWNL